MKKILSIILALTLTLTLGNVAAIPASADKLGAFEYALVRGGTEVQITRCRSVGDVVIPATIEGVPVTAIGQEAFYRSGVTSVVIPEGVTQIGYAAFDFCESLTTVTLPDSLEYVGERAFARCKTLKSVTIPGKNRTRIADRAFLGCEKLADLSLSDGVTRIGVSAFSYCESLTSVVLPDSVTRMDSSAFSGCSSLKFLTLSRGLTQISFSTFSGCSSLTRVVIPDSVTEIGSGAFAECFALEFITVPDHVTSIGSGAFAGCTALQEVTLPDSVANLAGDAFIGTAWYDAQPDGMLYIGTIAYTQKGDGAESVVIRDGTTVIASGAFYRIKWCEHVVDTSIPLVSITIPDSVKRIGYGAFMDCGELTTVHYAGSHIDRLGITVDDENDPLFGAAWEYQKTDGTGDVTGDNRTDMKDVLYIRKALADGLPSFECDMESLVRLGDVNGDGDVDMKDVLLIRQFIVGMLPTLPIR